MGTSLVAQAPKGIWFPWLGQENCQVLSKILWIFKCTLIFEGEKPIAPLAPLVTADRTIWRGVDVSHYEEEKQF